MTDETRAKIKQLLESINRFYEAEHQDQISGLKNNWTAALIDHGTNTTICLIRLTDCSQQSPERRSDIMIEARRLTLSELKPQMRVAYVPAHAALYPDAIEYGVVSSTNHKFAFVKFDRQLVKFGWDGTTSQSVRPEDLVAI